MLCKAKSSAGAACASVSLCTAMLVHVGRVSETHQHLQVPAGDAVKPGGCRHQGEGLGRAGGGFPALEPRQRVETDAGLEEQGLGWVWVGFGLGLGLDGSQAEGSRIWVGFGLGLGLDGCQAEGSKVWVGFALGYG